MSDRAKIADDVAGYLLALARAQGGACATVKDGYILLFRREYLKEVIEQNETEMVVIFVKRGGAQDAH